MRPGVLQVGEGFADVIRIVSTELRIRARWGARGAIAETRRQGFMNSDFLATSDARFSLRRSVIPRGTYLLTFLCARCLRRPPVFLRRVSSRMTPGVPSGQTGFSGEHGGSRDVLCIFSIQGWESSIRGSM
jgi:hypothetical protein